MSEVARWADVAMFSAEPVPTEPQVTVISMTQNPLRVMAAAAQLYTGVVVRDPQEINDDTALSWLRDMEMTKLNAALELIDIHMFIEGVTRAFVDQLRTQRTAMFVVESLRFAVKQDLPVIMPPGIAALAEDHPSRAVWENTVSHLRWAYNALIDAGLPAEDARGLIPLNVATRVHYKTNLRNLMDHAGMRLCSQAQYEWKQVWAGIIAAIRAEGVRHHPRDVWQYDAIVSMFKPICYQTGKCEFMGKADRACVIRDRVMLNHAAGVPPSEWTNINPLEPLMEGAARTPR